MQSESEKVPSVRVWRRNRPSRRNHERNAQQESHSKEWLLFFFEHCRACTKQCSEITKDSVQSTAFLLHIAEDSKGKALSEADRCLRSSQSRLICLLQSDKIGWNPMQLFSPDKSNPKRREKCVTNFSNYTNKMPSPKRGRRCNDLRHIALLW